MKDLKACDGEGGFALGCVAPERRLRPGKGSNSLRASPSARSGTGTLTGVAVPSQGLGLPGTSTLPTSIFQAILTTTHSHKCILHVTQYMNTHTHTYIYVFHEINVHKTIFLLYEIHLDNFLLNSVYFICSIPFHFLRCWS